MKVGSFVLTIAYSHSRRSTATPARLLSWSGRTGHVLVGNPGLQFVASAIGTFLARLLAEKRGMLVHGCLLVKNGRGYIFFGPSGAGKSTIARNATGFSIVSDDTCAVRFLRNRWMAFGIPMLQGNGRPALPISVPLDRLFLIKKHAKNKIESMASKEAFPLFTREVMIPFESSAARHKVFSSALNLVDAIKPQKLLFKKDLDVSTLFH